METENSGQVFEEGQEKAETLLEKADRKENQVLNAVKDVQKQMGKVTPVPTDLDAVASPSDLKARLEWGEPALSILDVRDRPAFNYERITGSVLIPIEDLVDQAQSAFEPNRDLYVYSDSDAQTVEAVTQLYSAGFKQVSAIKGGLPAWKAISGQTEGQVSLEAPTMTPKARQPLKV
jgi:rhodanese-related sulfurtransferase